MRPTPGIAARKAVKDITSKLSSNTGLTVNLALSYGARLEILDAVRSITEKVQKGELSVEDIDELTMSQYLQTHSIPDPDLLIRTSGEMRLSNFLLWQLAYTEIYVSETLWPDFRKAEFYKAIEVYQQRERRFGKVSEQLDKVTG